MKIFYIANIRIPTEKAHGLAIMKMCEAFANMNMKIELVVPNRKNHIKSDSFEYYGVKRNFEIIRLWCLDMVKFGWLGFLVETLTFMGRMAWRVMFKNGIFYTRDEAVALCLKMLGKKVFWEAHTAKSPLWAFLLRSVDGVIAISGGLKDYYVSKGLDQVKIMVAHSGVDLAKFDIKKSKEELRRELSLPVDKKIVAYIGKRQTMGEGKGVEELEEILHSLSVENPCIYPLIITDAPPQSLPLYMKASDVLVMNYPNTEHYAKYMSPLKLFEYMASGTPILAPDLPSIREVLSGDNAFFFDPDDPNGLTNRLVEIIRDEVGGPKAQRALADSANYTWAKRAKVISEFI